MNPTSPNILTCVYCGHEYPEGTPPHGSQVLTDHIKVCDKHPMKKCQQERDMLRKALSDFVGVETKEELEIMELTIRQQTNVPERDKVSALNAIYALQQTL